MLADAAGWLIDAKLVIIDVTGLAKDALHVHIGLALFIGTRLFWRGRGGWVVAWLVALAGTLTGELLDSVGTAAPGHRRPDAAHWHDIWNTMMWPTLFLLVGRWLNGRPDAAAETRSGEDGEQPFEQA